MKKKMEDMKDEERIHRQLREINEDAIREKYPKGSYPQP
jgi:hypothetical protein